MIFLFRLTIQDFKRYKAGQYLYIYLPEISLFQIHPFSVITTPETDKDCSVIIEVVGGWTQAVQKSLLVDNIIRNAWIDGAYGFINIPYFRNLPVSIFVAGGIGITPIISLLKYLRHSQKEKENNKKIMLIWSSRNTELFNEFADDLGSFHNSNLNVSLKLFYTGKDKFNTPLQDFAFKKLNNSSYQCKESYSNSSVCYQSIVHEKPNFKSIFRDIAIDIGEENNGMKRVGVFVCGSKRLSNSILSSCVSTRKCHFTVHSESFTL